MIKLKPLLELWMPGSLSLDRNPSPLSYADAPSDELLQYVESDLKQDNPDWFMFSGTNDWNNKKARCFVQINENDKPVKIWAEIDTRGIRKSSDTKKGHHDRVNKTIRKITRAWSSEARKLRRTPLVSENGNTKTMPWKECFLKALECSKVAPYIRDSGSIADPVNFTPRK